VSVTTGRPPGFWRAFGRRLIEQLGGLVLIGGPIIAASAAWDASWARQGWQDKVAGTTMVSVKRGPAVGTALSVSRSAAQLDVPAAPLRARPMLPPPLPPPVVRDVRGPLRPDIAVTPAYEGVIPVRPAGGLIADVPGFAPEADLVVPSVNREDPDAETDLAEDLDHTQLSSRSGRRTGTYELHFDTGETVIVSGSGLVGRNPAPQVGELVDHLVPISDLTRSVSKTHLEFGSGPDGLWVSDRDSTNGTRVILSPSPRRLGASG
jgi:hypothetical protein